MLEKLPQGWFRLYGALQTSARAHGGELLYEVDLSAGGSLMLQLVFGFRFYFRRQM